MLNNLNLSLKILILFVIGLHCQDVPSCAMEGIPPPPFEYQPEIVENSVQENENEENKNTIKTSWEGVEKINNYESDTPQEQIKDSFIQKALKRKFVAENQKLDANKNEDGVALKTTQETRKIVANKDDNNPSNKLKETRNKTSANDNSTSKPNEENIMKNVDKEKINEETSNEENITSEKLEESIINQILKTSNNVDDIIIADDDLPFGMIENEFMIGTIDDDSQDVSKRSYDDFETQEEQSIAGSKFNKDDIMTSDDEVPFRVIDERFMMEMIDDNSQDVGKRSYDDLETQEEQSILEAKNDDSSYNNYLDANIRVLEEQTIVETTFDGLDTMNDDLETSNDDSEATDEEENDDDIFKRPEEVPLPVFRQYVTKTTEMAEVPASKPDVWEELWEPNVNLQSVYYKFIEKKIEMESKGKFGETVKTSTLCPSTKYEKNIGQELCLSLKKRNQWKGSADSKCVKAQISSVPNTIEVATCELILPLTSAHITLAFLEGPSWSDARFNYFLASIDDSEEPVPSLKIINLIKFRENNLSLLINPKPIYDDDIAYNFEVHSKTLSDLLYVSEDRVMDFGQNMQFLAENAFKGNAKAAEIFHDDLGYLVKSVRSRGHPRFDPNDISQYLPSLSELKEEFKAMFSSPEAIMELGRMFTETASALMRGDYGSLFRQPDIQSAMRMDPITMAKNMYQYGEEGAEIPEAMTPLMKAMKESYEKTKAEQAAKAAANAERVTDEE